MEQLKSLWKNAISTGLQLFSIYAIFKLRWGQESWFKDKVSDALSLLFVYIVLFIGSLIFPLISPPVIIKIIQPNKRYPESNETRFSVSKKKITLEIERTVALKVNVKKRYSLWGTLVARILKNHNLEVLIEPATQGIVLQANEVAIRTDIHETQAGFIIHLGEYLSRIISRSELGETQKECQFIIIQDMLNPVTSEKIQINPMLLRNGQKAPGILSLLLGLKYDTHIVNFTRE